MFSLVKQQRFQVAIVHKEPRITISRPAKTRATPFQSRSWISGRVASRRVQIAQFNIGLPFVIDEVLVLRGDFIGATDLVQKIDQVYFASIHDISLIGVETIEERGYHGDIEHFANSGKITVARGPTFHKLDCYENTESATSVKSIISIWSLLDFKKTVYCLTIIYGLQPHDLDIAMGPDSNTFFLITPDIS